MSHKCDDNGGTQYDREWIKKRNQNKVYVVTYCSVCGAVVARDFSHWE